MLREGDCPRRQQKKSEPEEETVTEGMVRMGGACFCQLAGHGIPASPDRSLFTVLSSQMPRARTGTCFTGAEELCNELYVTVSIIKQGHLESTALLGARRHTSGWALAHACRTLGPPQNHQKTTNGVFFLSSLFVFATKYLMKI